MSALTKILIVLQLFFAVVCSVLLVLMVSKTENYKSQVEQANAKNVGLAASYAKEVMEKSAALANATALQTQLAAANNSIARNSADANAAAAKAEASILDLQNKINALNSQVATLNAALTTATASIAAKDTQLDSLRPQVSDLTIKYNEIYRAKNEADNQIRAAEQAIRKLQEIIAQNPAPSTNSGAGAIAPIGLEGQIQSLTTVAPGAKINAQISGVLQSEGRTLIEMPLGSKDGMKVGAKIFVYRTTGYVGDATIQRVSPSQSVAIVDSTKPGETVRNGDLVSTLGN